MVCFFNDTATTELYTLSLHDALPIYRARPFSTVASSSGGQLGERARCEHLSPNVQINVAFIGVCASGRSEEHTSELQSHSDLVCRLLLEKKKNQLNSV